MEALTAKKSRNELVNKTLELVRERKDDDDVYDVSNFYFLSHPEKINKNSLKLRRQIVTRTLKERLQELYDKEEENIFIAQMTSSKNHQDKFILNPYFKAIHVAGVEVNCSMVSSNENKYNVSKVNRIQFKGEMANIMTEFQNRCKREIESTFKRTVNDIFQPAAYAKEHNEIACKWPCEQILQACAGKFSHLLDSMDSKERSKICFYNRQVIGQGIIPYIARPNETDDDQDQDEGIMNCVNTSSFVFDNMFMDNKCDIMGIDQPVVNLTGTNFLDTEGRERCSALMSFNLSHVGITSNGGMTLYLNTGHTKMYCTMAHSDSDITSCSEYLENEALHDKDIQSIIKTRKGIDLCGGVLQPPKRTREEDCGDGGDENNDEVSQSKKFKSEGQREEVQEVQEVEEEEEEEEQQQGYKQTQEKFLKMI